MSADATPDETTPDGTTLDGGAAAGLPPRHRRRRGRSTVVLTGVAAAVAAAVAIGQFDKPAAKTQNAAASAGTSSSGTSSSGSTQFSGSQGSNEDWSPYPGSGWGYSDPWSYGYADGSSSSAGTSTQGSGAPSNVSAIAAAASPGLVDINSTLSYEGASGAGTGIVLTATGEILTNNHVIDGATSISVTDVGNGKTYKATVVGYDKTHDIAVLQLQGASGLQTAKIGDSSKATVGESVVAVGNAGGTGGTPSAAGGSIIALNQHITASDELGGASEQLTGLIEVNADVQPGDSGGSLVNSAGQVVGIDTAASGANGDPFALYASGSTGNQGFAIPINEALTIAREVVAGKASATVHIGGTAFLGVLLASDPVGGSGVSGAAVSGVVDSGTAAKAGLADGDVITSLGGHAVDSATTLSTLMAGYHPGTKVELGWTDGNGQSHTETVVLSSGPAA